jgi:hypothetical protein
MRGFDGALQPARKSGVFKGCRQAPRSGAELQERSDEASGLEHGARAGISPINSKPPVLDSSSKGSLKNEKPTP